MVLRPKRPNRLFLRVPPEAIKSFHCCLWSGREKKLEDLSRKFRHLLCLLGLLAGEMKWPQSPFCQESRGATFCRGNDGCRGYPMKMGTELWPENNPQISYLTLKKDMTTVAYVSENPCTVSGLLGNYYFWTILPSISLIYLEQIVIPKKGEVIKGILSFFLCWHHLFQPILPPRLLSQNCRSSPEMGEIRLKWLPRKHCLFMLNLLAFFDKLLSLIQLLSTGKCWITWR